MALDFPASPTDGQVYANWIYSTATGAWLSKPLTGPKSTYGPTPPANPGAGDEWVNSNDMTAYGWYVDTDGGQWVEKTAPISANGYYSPNYIINGAFEINQRAFTSTTTQNTFGPDRWYCGFGGGTTTFSLESFAPGTNLDGDEPLKYVRVLNSGQSGTSVTSILRQKIEDVTLLSGKTITVSFWAKAASGTPKIALEFTQDFGSGGSPSISALTYGGQVTISTSWARYSTTVAMPSVSGKTLGTTANTSNTILSLWTSAGTDYSSRTGSIGIQNNTFDFWGVQLEVGSTATAFRRNANSIQGELAACQRYYQYSTFGQPALTNGSVKTLTVTFTPPMRATPTTSVAGISGLTANGGDQYHSKFYTASGPAENYATSMIASAEL